MFVKVEHSIDLPQEDYVLVYPSVSVGGVGQLAVDILLNNIPGVTKIGYFYDRFFSPAAGPDPFDRQPQTICTSNEVFLSKSRKLVIVQQRSPFIRGCIPHFRKQLVKWIKDCRFRKIIILGSCSSHIQNDGELNMSTNRMMYLSSDDNQSLETSIQQHLQWIKFKHSRQPLAFSDSGEELFIPGGGITKTLFHDCCSSSVSVIALLVFSNDGNGTPDAMTIADGFHSLLPLISNVQPFKSDSWNIPDSWSKSSSTTALQQMY